MSCRQCRGLDDLFGDRVARQDLRRYRKRGPHGTTRRLLDALRREGVEGARVLDVGGGVGAIPFALLAAGAREAAAVEASRAYLAAARSEAERQGVRERVAFHHGDAVQLCAELDDADVVTLDRVLCCYHDPESLVAASASRARRLYGAVYPRSAWWTRWAVALGNAVLRLRRDGMRFYVHPPRHIEGSIEREGFARVFAWTGAFWRVEVYRRSGAVGERAAGAATPLTRSAADGG